MTTNGMLIFLMAFLFLFLGYLGVPVAFALIAGVLVVTAFTPVSLPSMMTQLFNGIDIEALLGPAVGGVLLAGYAVVIVALGSMALARHDVA